MVVHKNIVLERTKQKPILVDTFYHTVQTKQPIIIFCHGYKGFKDWGAWNVLATAIANDGCCFVKFNFSHNGGTINNPIDFPDLEAFGNNNYTKELDDLTCVIDWAEQYFKNQSFADTTNICVVGHSRGGGIAIVKAAEDARIKSLITLASISDFGKRTATTSNLEAWQKNGVKYVLNGRTKQQMPHYYQFYEDFKANEDRLHIATALKKITIPTLIIHGNKDSSIAVQEAEEMHQWATHSQLIIVNNADHVFNTKHPWASQQLSPELNQVRKSIITFVLP